MTAYNCINNQTIFDVALNTYGTLDRVGKLMGDNNWTDVTTYPTAGQVLYFDETLVNVIDTSNLAQSYSPSAGELQLKYATR
jgi:hypothetical protein